jgi:tetratricopeptide (TPR) repeat protein
MKSPVALAAFLLLAALASVTGQGGSAPAGRTLTVVTEPAAIVWVDEIRRGTTDENGKLTVAKISAGGHTLRVRANGFKEISLPIPATARGELPVRLTRSTDQAELIFQRAEAAREMARSEEGRQKAAELYRQALQVRATFPAAQVGLARVLLDLNNGDQALQAIEAARRSRPSYPEASAVEGRIYRELGQTDEAIGSFNRAIRESRGWQPEARVGLALIYEEKGDHEMAAREFQIAINQLADTEPIIYQMLGAAYEKAGNPKEAIVAYENYLRLAPNGSQATAVRSIVEQLKSEPPQED